MSFLLFLLRGAEAHGLFADAPGDNLFQSDEGAATNEEDAGGIEG